MGQRKDIKVFSKKKQASEIVEEVTKDTKEGYISKRKHVKEIAHVNDDDKFVCISSERAFNKEEAKEEIVDVLEGKRESDPEKETMSKED